MVDKVNIDYYYSY